MCEGTGNTTMKTLANRNTAAKLLALLACLLVAAVLYAMALPAKAFAAGDPPLLGVAGTKVVNDTGSVMGSYWKANAAGDGIDQVGQADAWNVKFEGDSTGGTLTLRGFNLDMDAKSVSGLDDWQRCAIYAKVPLTIVLEGASALTPCIDTAAVNVEGNAPLTIKGSGSLGISTSTNTSSCIEASSPVTVQDGTVSLTASAGSGYASNALTLQGWGTLTVSGGSLTCTSTAGSGIFQMNGSGVLATVTGGKLVATGGTYGIRADADASIGTPTTPLVVTGGSAEVQGGIAATYDEDDVSNPNKLDINSYPTSPGFKVVASPNATGDTDTMYNSYAPKPSYTRLVITPKATYPITYKPGTDADAGQSDQSATKVENEALTLLGATYTRAGYTQTGWSTSDGGDKELDLGGSFVVDVSLDLYPTWTRTPEPSENTESGITPGQSIAQGDTASFTAVGGGMEITSPKAGDMRFLPTSWKLDNGTPSAFADTYTVSFSTSDMSIGTHKITTTYVKQVFDGTTWQAVAPAVTDTKTVEFVIAKPVAPVPAPTPATTTPKTGDGTSPVPWLALVLLAGAMVATCAIRARRA